MKKEELMIHININKNKSLEKSLYIEKQIKLTK